MKSLNKDEWLTQLKGKSPLAVADRIISQLNGYRTNSQMRSDDVKQLGHALLAVVELAEKEKINDYVHIEHVYEAFAAYMGNTAKITRDYTREPGKWASKVQYERENLRKFCIEHNLPIDFTERSS
jgi:hypothetical protein